MCSRFRTGTGGRESGIVLGCGWRFRAFLDTAKAGNRVPRSPVSPGLVAGRITNGVNAQVVARRGYSALIFRAQGLVVWLDHDFEKLQNRDHLVRAELFQQFVRLLYGVDGHIWVCSQRK
jgi:hypothetical protein